MRKGTIQIAGALDIEDALTIVHSGVDALALPLGPFLKTPELSEAKARAIIQRVNGQIDIVAITYLKTAAEILSLLESFSLNRVQLHGKISIEETQALGKQKKLFVMKAFAVQAHEDIARQMNAFTPHVDAFLLDTFDPKTGTTGATGRVHDWMVSNALIGTSARPVILAGGLNPTNVATAIETTRPFGVDVHTGVEGADGRKSTGLLKAFVEKCRVSKSFSAPTDARIFEN